MPLSVQTLTTISTDIKAGADTVAGLIEKLDPAEAVPAEAASAIFDEIENLIAVGLAALVNAAKTPITEDSIDALAPDETPLTPPAA